MNESVVYVKHASIKSVKNLIVNTFCPRMLLHTTLIIDDVNILTVWHKLAYWPVGDQSFIAVILVSRWIAGGPGAGSAGTLSVLVLRTRTKNQTRRGLLQNAMGRPTKC